MAEQMAELNKRETKEVQSSASATNSSAVTVSASTWTKVCSVDTRSLTGKYLLISSVSYAVEQKITYARISRNGTVDYTIVNVPYGTGHLSFLADLTEYNSIDLFVYGQAQTIPATNVALRAFKL